jgi:hypothetical protein
MKAKCVGRRTRRSGHFCCRALAGHHRRRVADRGEHPAELLEERSPIHDGSFETMQS